MGFSSSIFLFLFLPVFLAAYLVAGRYRNLVLLAFSLLFYFFGEGYFVLVLLISIGLNYLVGLGLGRSRKGRRRWLLFGVCGNLALLAYFKYSEFLVVDVLQFPQPTFPTDLHLPIGISFFTFQGLSYLVDVYRGHASADRSIHRVAAYICMFPQLIAGPIVRYASISEQLVRRTVTARCVYFGLLFFSIGLAEKVVIADTLAELADTIYAAPPDTLHASAAWIGGLAYMFQIFFDFSGYSAMAIGLGLLLGFEFPRNFNFPYIAGSISEFWRRWHMTLSFWFRDYVYIPLGGNRLGAWRTYRNLILVFLLTGLWHGAAWNFIFWGCWHGLFILVERIGFSEILRQTHVGVRHVYTLAVVYFGWILFRSPDLEHAAELALQHFSVSQEGLSASAFVTNEQLLVLGLATLFSTPLMLRLSQTFMATCEYEAWRQTFPPRKLVTGLLVSGILFGLSAIKILSGSFSPFIYFRF
ncbi:MAG: MBOAT family protein [Pseudomonadota bacterium]